MTNPSVFATSRYPGWLVLLGILTATAPMSIDMYLPSFPAIQAGLSAKPGMLALTLSTFFIGMTLGQLFYGPFSDRFGRKPPLYAGYALYVLASIGCALSDDVGQLIVGRFIQGLGGCAGIVIPNAIVRDRTNARDTARAFSMLMLVLGAAPILAPWVGGQVLTGLGWRAVFGVLAAFGLACLTMIHLGLKESHSTVHEPPLKLSAVVGNYLYLLGNRPFMGYALAAGLAMSGMFAYIAGSPFVLMTLYGVKPEDYGLYFGANAIGLIAASQINGRLVQKWAPTTVLRYALCGPALTGIVLLVLAATGTISKVSFVIGFFVFVTSLGFIAPNAIASALATHGQMAGTAAALASALQFLIATLTGAGIGLLHDSTGLPLALMMALCGGGAFASHRLLVHRHERHRP